MAEQKPVVLEDSTEEALFGTESKKDDLACFENISSLQDMLKMLTKFPLGGDKNDDTSSESSMASTESSSQSWSDWKFVIGALSNAFQTTYKIKADKSVFDTYTDNPKDNILVPSLVDFVGDFLEVNECAQNVEIVDWVLTQFATVMNKTYALCVAEETDDETSGYEVFSAKYPDLIKNYLELSELRLEYELNDLLN